MPTVLVTGANRGIGLALARQYAADDWRVFASCRDPAAAVALQSLAAERGSTVSVHRLDVADGGSVAAAAAELRGEALDVVFNNAGVIGDRAAALGTMNYPAFEATLNTNVLGPVRVAEAFLDNLLAGERKTLATVSSRMGSLTHAQPNSTIYRTSKAAVNMAMRCIALALAPHGVTCILLHPGWVRTDMGGPAAAVAPEDSAAGMRRVVAKAGPGDNGLFFNYDGAAIAW